MFVSLRLANSSINSENKQKNPKNPSILIYKIYVPSLGKYLGTDRSVPRIIGVNEALEVEN